MRRSIFVFFTCILWVPLLWSSVHADLNGDSLRIVVEPYEIFKTEFYEFWYKARSQNPGDRFGTREYWLDVKPQEIRTSQQVCAGAARNKRLDLELKVDERLSIDENVKIWSLFPCLFQDTDSLALVYPKLEKLFSGKIKELQGISAQMEKFGDSKSISDPSRYLISDIRFNLRMMITVLEGDPKDYPVVKEDEYRNGLQFGFTRKPFDKKMYAPLDGIVQGPFVVVTHATTKFDFDSSIKKFTDEAIRRTKQAGLPLIYLVNDDREHDQSWFLSDREPTQAYFSKNGEHSVLFDSDEVILMGGYFNECFRVTQIDTITRHFIRSSGPLTLHLPISGIYAHEKNEIDFRKLSQDKFCLMFEEALCWVATKSMRGMGSLRAVT